MPPPSCDSVWRASPTPSTGQHRLAEAVQRGEDVPEPLVVGQRADLARRRSGPPSCRVMRVAPAAALAVRRERTADLHLAAQQRVADLVDEPRRLLGRERLLLVAGARARGPEPRDGQVVGAVRRGSGRAGRRRSGGRARRSGGCRGRRASRRRARTRRTSRRSSSSTGFFPRIWRRSSRSSRSLSFTSKPSGGVLGAGQLAAAGPEELGVDARPPVDGLEDADGALHRDELIGEAAEVFPRHAGKLPRAAGRTAVRRDGPPTAAGREPIAGSAPARRVLSGPDRRSSTWNPSRRSSSHPPRIARPPLPPSAPRCAPPRPAPPRGWRPRRDCSPPSPPPAWCSPARSAASPRPRPGRRARPRPGRPAPSRARLGSPGGGDGFEAARLLQEEGQSFNLRYLELQERMQRETREFTAVSNVMKVRHDAARAAIQNVQ